MSAGYTVHNSLDSGEHDFKRFFPGILSISLSRQEFDEVVQAILRVPDSQKLMRRKKATTRASTRKPEQIHN